LRFSNLRLALAGLLDIGEHYRREDAIRLRSVKVASDECSDLFGDDVLSIGLNSDGNITVAGTCSGTPALFLISNSHSTMLVGTGSGRADSELVGLSMPRLFDDGSIMFSAPTRAGGDGVYSIRPESGAVNPSGSALPLLFVSTSPVEALHSILVVSVPSNEHGRLAYLGGPIESLASQN